MADGCAVRSLGRLGETEIQHLDGTFSRQRDIRGLQIPVDNPLFMCGFEGLRDLLGNRESIVNRNWSSCDASIQALTVDEFEHEELLAVSFVQTVNGADVRMVQGSEDLGFAAESCETLGVVCERLGENLQRDVAPELRVMRAIHLAHAARAKERDDFVSAESGPDSDRHYFGGTRCFSSSLQFRTTSSSEATRSAPSRCTSRNR